MKKTIKKLMCLSLAMLLCIGTSHITFAGEISKQAEPVTVYSSEFPDAYIITETNAPNEMNSKSSEVSLQGVTATVFVEETYDLVNDEVVVTSSRLLSKDEVMAVGVKNFEPLENQKSVSPAAASNTRGTLTLTFDGSYKLVGNGVSANVTGNASWSGFDFLYSSKNNPAVGSDFMGVAWSGGFTSTSSSCTATWNLGGSQSVYLAESVPNAGRVWEFEEYRNVAGKYSIYVDNVDLNMGLSKASLTGGGNTAEIVLKYVHTYQKVQGGISISASPSGVGSGFSLSNTDKQWSIVCTLTGMPQ